MTRGMLKHQEESDELLFQRIVRAIETCPNVGQTWG